MIKFFNINDDKYFYLDSLEYAGKKNVFIRDRGCRISFYTIIGGE